MIWEAAGPYRFRLGFSFVASTLGMVCILAIIGVAMDPRVEGQPTLVPLLLFATAAFAVVLGNALGQRLSSNIVEDLLDDMRHRMTDLVRRAEFGRFEAIGSHTVYDSLTRNSPVLTEAALIAIHFASAFGALILGGFYTLLLSPLVFGVIAGLIVASSIFYRLTQRSTQAALEAANARQLSFLDLFRHLLEGFKEVKLNRKRGNDLEDGYILPESGLARDTQVEATKHISRGISVSYIFFYLCLATIAFILPPFVGEHRVIVKSIYVAVFLLSIVEVILRALPSLTRANFAIAELLSVIASLEEAAREGDGEVGKPTFEKIEATGLVYTYFDPEGAQSFTMGPLDLTLARGETLFVVGGNGSGKSTLLKTLTRLYEPMAGTIVWDGKRVELSNISAYRSLFSAVFSDFHLFDRLYGMRDVPEDTVNGLLEELGIANKTRFKDGGISNINLSTGQRKRLALAVALLEDRPIMVLDELAADQDPEFRQAFYNEFLPRWKAEGRTLVIVSHDDRYFDIADNVVKLRDGRIFETGDGGPGGPAEEGAS